MKRWLLSCGFVIFALWLGLPSACAGGGSAKPDLPARYKELSPLAEDYLQSPKRNVAKCDKPDEAILAPKALVMLWKLFGKPKASNKVLPFSAGLSAEENEALRWAGEELLKAIGYEPEKPEAKEKFRKNFPKMKLYNKDVVSLFYKLEWRRIGKAPQLPAETKSQSKSQKIAPYTDVDRGAPFANAVRWAGGKSLNLISGVLDETTKKAVHFNPEQEKIGKGICTRGQFFVLLYLYAQSLEIFGKSQQKAA